MSEKHKLLPECAKCHIKNKIYSKPDGQFPKFWATKLYQDAAQGSKDELTINKNIKHFMKISTMQAAEGFYFED